jgi:hypothetical protein
VLLLWRQDIEATMRRLLMREYIKKLWQLLCDLLEKLSAIVSL